MATGIFTSLADYNPPSIVPLSLQCADTDPTIGVYSGFCNVRRPESEGGVTAYEIFWGRNATHTLPGASSLGRAELNASSGELVTAIIETTSINPAATHLVALAAGPGGVEDFKYTADLSKFRPGRIFKPRRKYVEFFPGPLEISGVAPFGIGAPVMDNSGLTLNPGSLNVVATPGSTSSNSILLAT